MGETETFWLNVTNAAFGIAVAACLACVVCAFAYELVIRVRRHRRFQAELDRDMRALAESADWLTPEQPEPAGQNRKVSISSGKAA